jgi:hypothetical protein
LLNDASPGIWEDEVFHTEVIVNDRVSALFALRPRTEYNLIPEHVIRDAEVSIDAEREEELVVDGVSIRTRKVTIPKLRIGKFVSRNIPAYVLPKTIWNLQPRLTDSAFPGFRLEFRPGESVLKVKAPE